MNTVVITGAASGMGLEATELFLSRKWNVVMADFDDVNGVKIAKKLSDLFPGQVYFHKTDVSNDESVANLFDASIKQFKTIDSVINNAGIFVKGALHEVQEDAWDRIMNIDVKPIYLMTKYFVPAMIEQQHGSIVNTASISGMTGDYNMAAYSAAKGAVVNLVRSMALDYGKYNIRVNNIVPGPTNTALFQKNPQNVIDGFKNASPIGRLTEPEDIARMMFLLASDEVKSITGQNIQVNTGFGIYSNQPVQ